MLVKDDVVKDIHASRENLQLSITLKVLISSRCGMMLHTNAVSSRHCFVDWCCASLKVVFSYITLISNTPTMNGPSDVQRHVLIYIFFCFPSFPSPTPILFAQIFPGCGWMKLRSDLCLSDLIIELRLPVLCYKTSYCLSLLFYKLCFWIQQVEKA